MSFDIQPYQAPQSPAQQLFARMMQPADQLKPLLPVLGNTFAKTQEQELSVSITENTGKAAKVNDEIVDKVINRAVPSNASDKVKQLLDLNAEAMIAAGTSILQIASGQKSVLD